MASPMPCSRGKLRVPSVFELADVGAVRSGVADEWPKLFDLVRLCTHIMPVPMGADRNLCRLVPK